MVHLITESFAPLLDKACWNVQHGHGSFITLEFGEPRVESLNVWPMPLPPALRIGDEDTKIQRRVTVVRGDWHLWIYCCAWSLCWEGRELAHSESPADQIRVALSLLNGQLFEGLETDPGNGSSQFSFDLGCTLRTWPYAIDPRVDPELRSKIYVQWHLYQPSGLVLSVDSSGRVVNQPGSTRKES